MKCGVTSYPTALTGFAVTIALACSLCVPAQAADEPKPDKPDDFYYGIPVQVSGKQGVVGLKLPQAVYQNSRSTGLDDLRVFDARGVAQPFSLYRPPLGTPTQRSMMAATVFPLRTRVQPEGAAAVDVDIETRPDGTVSSVKTRATVAKAKAKGTQPVQEAGEEKLTGLVLDFGAAMAASPLRIDALRFGAPKDQANYSAEIWLEASNDLRRWETVGAAELSWLSNDDQQTLSRDRLEFAPQKFRYARLTWRRGEPVMFADIRAETIAQQYVEPPRETLWVKPQPGRFGGDLVYPAGVAIPVEQISLKLTEPNIVYPMVIGHYVQRPARQPGKAAEWAFQPRSGATFYQITQDGEVRRSASVTVPVGREAEWVIRPLNPSATAQPELGLSWQPATLVFLAGGTPPYTLSFGRDDARPANQPLDQVAPGFSTRELDKLEQAQVGQMQESAARANAERAAAEAARWEHYRKLALWAVLLLGVGVLAGMAWKLVGQMRQPETAKARNPEKRD